MQEQRLHWLDLVLLAVIDDVHSYSSAVVAPPTTPGDTAKCTRLAARLLLASPVLRMISRRILSCVRAAGESRDDRIRAFICWHAATQQVMRCRT